jgi:hypothetical protein
VKFSTQLITSDMNILKRFLKCCSGNVAQPQGLCDHLTSHTTPSILED